MSKTMPSEKKILFVVNAPGFFLSHRLPLATAARKSGFEVHVASSMGPEVRCIVEGGFYHHRVDFSRSGQNPLFELKTLFQLFVLLRRLRPDIVHLITIKPVLYGGWLARWTGVRAVVAAISGLGTVFVADSFGARVRKLLVKQMYAMALKHPRLTVVFQNPDDHRALQMLGVLDSARICFIRGSGVALDSCPVLPEPVGQPVVVMAARLLKDKGVLEFVEAARLLRGRKVAVTMRLIGAPDIGNPTSVTERDITDWANEGAVELLGYRTDIAAQYGASHLVCLPSYREGLPKSLIEAAACGRAVVTTDVPGCRDAITPDVTGVLVPARDANALANAIQMLIEDSALRSRMGMQGRRLAELSFTIEAVVERHMQIYGELLSDG